LATDPRIEVVVSAAIGQLENGMAQAEQTVASAAANMTQSVERMSLGQRFDTYMKQGAAGAKRLGIALGGLGAAGAAAAGDIEGAFRMLPGVFGMVGSSAMALGKMIGEQIFGSAAEELEKFKKEMAELDRATGFRTQARDAERLVAIEQETNTLARIELQRRNEIAKVRQSILTMETEGANAEAVAAVAAQERLINVKAENAVKAEMARRSEEEAKKDEERSEYRRKQAEDAARLAEEKRKAQQVASQEIEDIQSLIVIAKEQDQLRENELQLEMKLRDIRRDRKELTEQIGAEAARNLMLAREELAIVNAEQRAKEITAKREQEAQKAEADALKEELRQRQDMLKALDRPMSLTQSIQTSIGGSFTVANSSVQSAMKSIAERQSTLQQQIKELVERISQQVSGMQGGLA
jgi:hypothetical protein